MINEWMTSQGDEHKKQWLWCGVAHAVKERKEYKIQWDTREGNNQFKDF